MTMVQQSGAHEQVNHMRDTIRQAMEEG